MAAARAWWLAVRVSLAGVPAAAMAQAPPDALAVEPPAAAVYAATWVPGPPHRVELTLTLPGDADGESAFSASPMWGGIDRCAQYLRELAFSAADGTALAAEQPDPDHWSVRHAAGATLVARWRLEPLANPLPAQRGNDYRPQVRPDLLHLIGNTGLLRPDALADGEPHRLRWEWRGFAEAGFKVASSFGGDPAGVTVEQTLDAFTHAIFIAGDLRLHERVLRDRRLLFAFHGAGLGCRDDELVDLATKIIETERDFFADWSDPLYVITLLVEPRRSPGSTSLGGTGLTNSFALFVTAGIDLKSGGDDRRRIAHLLAHEYFHRWNGGAIANEQPEGSGYWFSEGFTDFFARRLLLRAGLSDAKEYVASLNDSLRKYWLSPVKREPAARIVQDFWKNAEVGELPYRRGDLVALLLDHEIRAVSEGRRSLDDFMREAIARGRGGEPITTAGLMELVADDTSLEFAERIRGIVVDGAPVELDDDTFAPLLRLGRRRVPRDGSTATIEIPWFELGAAADSAEARRGL